MQRDIKALTACGTACLAATNGHGVRWARVGTESDAYALWTEVAEALGVGGEFGGVAG